MQPYGRWASDAQGLAQMGWIGLDWTGLNGARTGGTLMILGCIGVMVIISIMLH